MANASASRGISRIGVARSRGMASSSVACDIINVMWRGKIERHSIKGSGAMAYGARAACCARSG